MVVLWAAMMSLWCQIKHRQKKREINLPTILMKKYKNERKKYPRRGQWLL
jgi:hypothetical protein